MKTKRIKQVFGKSSQVFHLWANQSQAEARQGGRIQRAFFEGTSCYSYGRHYELGRIVKYKGVQLAIVNNSGYSNTTTKHIKEAYFALDGIMPCLQATTFNVKDALAENKAKLEASLAKILRGRKFWKDYSFDESWACEQVKEFNLVCAKIKAKCYQVKVTSEFRRQVKAHVKKCLQREAELKSPEHLAKLETTRARRQAAELKKNEDSVQQWQNGLIPATAFIRALRPMLIRIVQRNGIDTVETSLGAEVPLVDAAKVLRAIENGTAIKGMQIGSFVFNSIDGGIVKIGCHTFDLNSAKAVLNSTRRLKAV